MTLRPAAARLALVRHDAELVAQLAQERSAQLPQLRVDPFFERLRVDPRFHERVRRVGCPG